MWAEEDTNTLQHMLLTLAALFSDSADFTLLLQVPSRHSHVNVLSASLSSGGARSSRLPHKYCFVAGVAHKESLPSSCLPPPPVSRPPLSRSWLLTLTVPLQVNAGNWATGRGSNDPHDGRLDLRTQELFARRARTVFLHETSIQRSLNGMKVSTALMALPQGCQKHAEAPFWPAPLPLTHPV